MSHEGLVVYDQNTPAAGSYPNYDTPEDPPPQAVGGAAHTAFSSGTPNYSTPADFGGAPAM